MEYTDVTAFAAGRLMKVDARDNRKCIIRPAATDLGSHAGVRAAIAIMCAAGFATPKFA